MNPDQIKAIKQLLGEGFRQEDIERWIEEDPHLLASAAALQALVDGARRQDYPPLPKQFSAQVLARLPVAEKLRLRLVPSRRVWRWAVPLLAAAVLVLAIWGPFRRLQGPAGPGIEIREVAAPGGGKAYEVSIAVRDPEAKNIFVAGDFSQWEPLPLRRKGEIFWITLRLPPGNFLYSFWIDEKTWSPLQAPMTAPDDFGSVNGLLKI